jgi:hypothetical protein
VLPALIIRQKTENVAQKAPQAQVRIKEFLDSFTSHISSAATPVFGHIHQQRPNQSEYRSPMRKYPHHPGSASDFPIEPFEWIDGMNRAMMFLGNVL